MKRVAVLTVPDFVVGTWSQAIASRFRRLARRVYLGGLGRQIGRSRVSGPDQVARSIIVGLRENGFEVHTDPLSLCGDFEIVFVPAGLAAFHAVLTAKRLGWVRCVVAGPNLCMNPEELNLKSAPSLPDFYVMPSEWAKRRWLGLQPDFPIPVVVEPAGVDPREWYPIAGEKPRRVLIYDKWGDTALTAGCIEAVEGEGWQVSYLRYGKFEQSTYRQLLGTAGVVVYLSKSESQGIALFEAWAMDVPTLVFDASTQGVKEGSPAPYLSFATGAHFGDPTELPGLLKRTGSAGWRPREWIMENGTDASTVRNLLHLINKEFK